MEISFIVTDYLKCLVCGGVNLKLQKNNSKADHCYWKCKRFIMENDKKKLCNGNRSARSNSWFFKSKLAIGEILLFTYHWWYETPSNLLKLEYGFAAHTIVDWSSFCREVAIDQVMNNPEKIGGEGKIVEIDESKFGKST